MIDGLKPEKNILTSILEQSDESASFLFDISDGANAVTDSSGRIIIANLSFFRMLNADYSLINSGFSLTEFFEGEKISSLRFFLNERILDPYNSPKTSVFSINACGGERKKAIFTAVRIPGTNNILVSAVEPDSVYAKNSSGIISEKEDKSDLISTDEVIDNDIYRKAGSDDFIALEDLLNDYSFEKGNLRNYQLELLNEILISANSSFILSKMLDNVLNLISKRLGFEICFIYLKNNDGKTAEIVSALDVPMSFIESQKNLDVRSWPNNLIFYAGQPKYVENLADVNISRYDINILESLGALSYAAIPLVSENTVLGAIFIAKAYGCSFSPFEKETLELIGHEVSSIILRGILQERLEKECSETKQCFGIVLDDINDLNEDLMLSVEKITDSKSSLSYLADRMSTGIHENRLILKNLRILREIREGLSRELKETSLDSVIQIVIDKNPKIRINYSKSDIFVFSDEYLIEVFENLVYFLTKTNEAKSEIFIESVSSSGEANISIEIKGPGLSDEEKMLLFSDFDEENLHLDSNTLCLYIVFILVKRYEGEIAARDRIPGDRSKGLCFNITLGRCSARN